MSLVIVGTMAYDDVETPVASAENILAGSATYLAFSASILVKNPKIISIVGGDFKTEDIELFKKKGIDISGVEIRKEGKTFRWKGCYHEDMNNRDTIFTHLNVVEEFNPIIPSSYYPINFLSLGNIDPDIQLGVLNQAKASYTVGDSMNLWIEIKTDSLKTVISKLDCFILNESEAVQLTGHKNLILAGKWIQSLGCPTVIIKKGENGAILLSEDNLFICPSFPTEKITDPTGAGDSFAGGFIGHLAATRDVSFKNMKEAVLVGSILAGFCIQSFGTITLQSTTHEQFKKRLTTFKQIISF